MKLLLSGYYGFGNAGDEWILEAFLKIIPPHQPEITVLSADPRATRRRHGVKSVNRWHPGTLVRTLLGCDLFISGGGGLIQDLSGPWTPGYYLGLIAGARMLGKRVVVVGQGFGPVRQVWNRWLCRGLLPGAELVMPRDPEGQSWCQEQGVPAKRVALGADWVWSLPAPRRQAGKDWAVCLRADGLRHGCPAWLKDFLNLARAQRRRVRFLVLGNGGDRECLAQAGCGFPEKDVVDLTGLSWAQAVECVQGSEWVLSMRYHGLILGAAAGAAVAGWGDDPKLGNLMRELQAPDLHGIKLSALKSLLADNVAARRVQAFGVARLRQRAQDMAERCRGFLMSG